MDSRIGRPFVAPEKLLRALSSKNRERLLDGEIAGRFLSSIQALPRVKRLLPSEYFSVDGTLIDAWCRMKNFRPK